MELVKPERSRTVVSTDRYFYPLVSKRMDSRKVVLDLRWTMEYGASLRGQLVHLIGQPSSACFRGIRTSACDPIEQLWTGSRALQAPQ